MAARLIEPFMTYHTSNGVSPLSGGKLNFFVAGTVSTFKDTFSDNTLLIVNPNPIVLDSAGRIPNTVIDVWGDGDYDLVVADSSDVEITRFDNVSGSLFLEPVTTIAALTALLKASLTNGDQINVTGYFAQGDGGGGDFFFDSTSTAAANGGTIIATDEGGTGRWLRIFDTLSLLMFGCVGDGTTDDTTAFQAALDFAGDFYGVDKTYLISSDLDFSNNTRLVGTGTLKVSDPTGFTTAIFHTVDKNDIEIEGWTFDWENDGAASVTCLSFDGGIRINTTHNKFLAPISSVSIASVRHRESVTRGHKDCRIDDNYFEVDKLGILLQSGVAFPGENTTIIGNIANCTTPAVGVAELIKIDLHEDNVVCSDNILDGTNAASCITAEEFLEEIVISGNTCRNSINGLDITGGQGSGSLENISVIGNTIDNCTNGIILGDTTTSPFTDGLTITGNTINNCTVAINGISWGFSSPVIISGNTFANFIDGIEMRGNANITGNTFKDAPTTTLGAIRFRGATSGLISGNQFIECLIDISLRDCSGIAAIGNNITSNGTDTPGKLKPIVLINVTASAIQSNYFNTVASVSLIGSITGSAIVIAENTFSEGLESGTHDGASNVATLSDSTATFTVNALVGYTVSNTTDGSSGLVTANTATTVTATLAGGAENDWDTSDAYTIVKVPAVTDGSTGSNILRNNQAI